MKFKISHLVLVVMAALSIGISACTEQIFVTPKVYGRISGQVIDNATKKPLSDVLIKLNPSGRSQQTDTSGTFSFDSLTAGKYTISAQKTGLYNEYVSVEVTEVQNPVATIYMSLDLKTNRTPTKPSNPIPAVGTTVNKVDSLLLAWTATDPDRDTLTYDIYLFEAGTVPTTPYIKDHDNDTLVVNNLQFDKTYYWQVVAKDGTESVFGPIWNFKTPKFPDLSYAFARQEDGKYQIYAANNDDTVVKLTSEGSNWRPVVSPNREQIAFISNRSTNLHIYVMNRDGSNLRQVTNVPVSGLMGLDLSFSWANNGSRIIYPSNNRLYSVNIDGTGRQEVARAPVGRQFAGADWNEATKTIITRTTGESIYDNELTLINTVSGSQETVLTSSRRVSNPVLSIDGGEILFSMDINEFKDEQGRQADARIFQLILAIGNLSDLSSTTNASGTTNTLLKAEGTNDLDPRYSPSGQGILFTNVNNDGTGPGLYTTSLSGGRSRAKVIDNAEMGYWRNQ